MAMLLTGLDMQSMMNYTRLKKSVKHEHFYFRKKVKDEWHLVCKCGADVAVIVDD